MARKSSSRAKVPAPPQAASPPPMENGVGRRSSRRVPARVQYTEPMSDDEGCAVEDDAATTALQRNPTVKRVVDELTELDDKLRRTSKRHKAMIENGVTALDNTDVFVKQEVPAAALNEQLTSPAKGRKIPRAPKGVSKKKEASAPAGRDISGGEEEEGGDGAYVGSEGDVKDGTDPVLEVAERGAARPPAVNSSYLPLPWKGRLGYACLNTYLRAAKPSVFCSRTCRMASIVEHRHPLQDPSLPEHATKNRPDKNQKPDAALGDKYVQELGLTNAGDIAKMIRWNDKYGIKFMRLSSEMFPFASHPEHGYRLAPFASEVLAEAGREVAGLGHRVTMHPGQFTQLGSPRKEVIAGSVRDLEYHDELLSLLKLPQQQNRDAVMIIHMGGVFGDKAATLDRFRENYANLLSSSIKARLVLENDDVSWSVHDLLPVCEELDIPLVLDFHHHNIVFDPTKLREGTYDITQPELMDRILATWRRKGIRPKMHYSEQCPGAVTPRDRRKHSPRVMTLPPCPPDMDLMIEAKDKEQAVFELMRTYKLPGFERINDMIPHEREDEDRPPAKVPKRKGKKKGKAAETNGVDDMDVDVEGRDMGRTVTPEEFGMGGPLNRVYWPLGMEHWLKPKKRESNKAKIEAEEEE
ncbi:UV-endonuclease UvdE-domain-containing protein [Coniochaeta sp. 2T2.1]|nr:UV-endonuclease UvdE-domain-containing protein [Coniochaeta sp. 2T2.1]